MAADHGRNRVGCYPGVARMHEGVRPRRPNPLSFRHKACRRIGRGERIRTSGPRLPKTVLYQAELLPGARGYSRLPLPWQWRRMGCGMGPWAT